MPGRRFPYRVGCVDTGSNAIRFLVAEFTAPSEFQTLAFERVPVRLGHLVFLTGSLAPGAIDKAIAAFAAFSPQIEKFHLDAFRAVATSAVREARNGDELRKRLKSEVGIDLETISGSEEARLVHLAVGSQIDLSGGQWILTDLGGGSVEVSLVDDMGVLWSESHTMGSVRLLEELSAASQDPGGFRKLAADYVSTLRIPDPAQYWSPSGFVATGGNAEALAALVGAPRDAQGVARLQVDHLGSTIDLLARLSYHQRMEELGLREDRADVILPAALVYHHLARLAGVDEILVPGVGVKEGILLDLLDNLISPTSHELRREEQLTKAAISLGRRFMFDEAHGVHVARLALSLFDQLKSVHGLPEEDRRLLLAASILHDVGTFISRKKHHKHSLYIISRSELPGLSPDEMLAVANIARYHRKNIPRARHPDFTRLSGENQKRTVALSGILRLGDALDRAHLQQIAGVEATLRDNEVLLRIEASGDSVLERWALAQKKNLFEKTYGKSISIAP